MSRPDEYPPERYESGRRSAERRSMRERAADFARGMSEQLGAVVENARGALRGREAGGATRGTPPSGSGYTAGYSAAMGSLPSEQRATLDERAYRRSRIRLLSRKWRMGRHNPHGLWYGVGFALSGLLLVATLGASAGGGYYAVTYYNANAAQIGNVARLAEVGSTTIYDRHGKVLYVAPKANGVNIYLKYDDISYLVDKATVSTEDRTFFDSSNIGIDVGGTLRAVLADVTKGQSQGGSTITQQLVKNLVLHDNQKALVRKINEAILSIGITESGTYKKWKILEMYLDTIDYSDGNLGIEAAAQNYFGLTPFKVTASKPCPASSLTGQKIPVGSTCNANEQLDWAQVAMLVGVPNAPSIFRPNQFTYDCGPNGKNQKTPCDKAHWDNPCVGDPLTSNNCYDGVTGEYFDYIGLGHEWLVYHRAKVVLDSLLRDNNIDQATHDKSLAEVLSILENHQIYSHAGNTTFSSSGATKLAPHFVDYVMQELQDQFGIKDVPDAGIKVYTTLDLDLDTYAIQRAQYYITKTHNMSWPTYCHSFCVNVPPLAQTDNVHNAAVVATDPWTGDILAMVGSVDYTSRDPKVDGFYNVATSESRSLGSSTKPIFYATAFQMGWNPGIMLQDQPVCFPNDITVPGKKPVLDPATPGCAGQWYTPHNFEPTSFSGNIPLRYALANSLNIPATEAMSFVGDSPDYSDNALAMAQRMGITSLTAKAMGPTTALGTQPISLLQLTNAYGVFAAGGKHVAPRSILEITFPDGRPPYRAPKQQMAQVMSAQTAYMITSILTDKAARIADFNYSNPLEFDDHDPNTPVNNLNYPAVAAKTGTSQGDQGARDIVTMGYSPYMALGVWAGNADSSDLGNVIGISGAGYIFHDVMAWAIKNYKWQPGQLFPIPPDMARGSFNCQTGLAPYQDKPDPGKCAYAPYTKGSTNIWAGYGYAAQRDTDWFIQGQQWMQS
ncbi:MAG TPA: transglycosylase domain-containing protein [Ktedonobacterales bacterium]|nr:transglycosylase domain-containing protein [Ktedonobacterales bacterium]